MKRKIVFSVLTVLLVVSLLALSFAWFYINESTYVDFGSDIKCEAGESLEISDDGGKSWSGVINKSGFSSSTIDITGDGMSFYKPREINENAEPIGFDLANPVDESGHGEYVTINLKFRSPSELSVYLSEDSFILPVDPAKKGNIFGDFSRDYIAGAARVSFIHNGEVKMVWAPNPQYELTKGDNGLYTFTDNGSYENYTYTKYENSAYSVREYTTDDYAFSKFLPGSTDANGTTAGKSARLFTIKPSAEGEYGVETLTICIWFEGTDREASEALAGGSVNVKLKFTGIDKDENTAGQSDIDALAYNNGTVTNIKNGMIYSFDGLMWNDVASFPTDLTGRESVYFRYPETPSAFATNINKISLS